MDRVFPALVRRQILQPRCNFGVLQVPTGMRALHRSDPLLFAPPLRTQRLCVILRPFGFPLVEKKEGLTWHLSSIVLSYSRRHEAHTPTTPLLTFVSSYLLAFIRACSCGSSEPAAHHPLRSQPRSRAGLQSHWSRQQGRHARRLQR